MGMAGGGRSHEQGSFGGDLIGPNPTDRAKPGSKRSVLVEADGGPLSVVVAGANVHDTKLLEATLEDIVVERPEPSEEDRPNLCLDKAYDNPTGRKAAAKELSQNTRPITSLNVFQDYLYGSAKRIRRSHMSEREKLGTIWEVSDELWERIEPVILEEDPPKARGRKRADAREMLNGIIFRLRSGCQWNQLPKELGDDSTIHRTLQRWVELGVMRRVWAALVEGCDELGGVQWEWQAADAAMSKARLGGT